MSVSHLKTSLKHNNKKFDKIVARISTETDINRQIVICSQAAIFAASHPCGIFNSLIIEKTLVEIATKNSLKLSDSYIPNSFLHIMTRAYTSGGHTRVCERWIKNASSKQVHSVALVSQGDREVPQLLQQATREKRGTVVALEENLPLDAALELRKLASHYHYIILHVHMYDVVPLLAFGTTEFKRPVIFFNHADHLFWLGCAITDLAINFRSIATTFNERRRAIKNNYVLPLPINGTKQFIKNAQTIINTKKQLGFAEDSKVIIVMAPTYKFKQFGKLNLIKTIEEILEQDKNAVLLAIGPSKKDREWRIAFKKNNGRINPIGVIPNNHVENYLQVADVALDSFPICSFTALLDIAQYGIPCVSLRTPFSSIDAFEEANIYCSNTSEVVKKIIYLLKNPIHDNKLYKILERDSLPQGFSKKLTELITHLPNEHKIHPVIQDNNETPTEFELLVCENSIQSHKGLNGKIKSVIRKLVYLYILYIFPYFMNKKLYRFLNSFGIM